MSSDGAEVRELKPKRGEARVGADTGAEEQLIRSERDHNRVAAQRITINEARRCLPDLRQAAFDAQLGQQLRQMAAYAGDLEVERELTQALKDLAEAASF